MTISDLAWMAGFLDGEGCVTISTRRKSNHSWGAPLVTITNRDRKVLELFKATFGGYIVEIQRKKPHHSQCWSYMAFNAKARYLLIALRPYLKVKALHADVVLRFSDTMRSRIPTGDIKPYTIEEHAKRDQIVAEIRNLNRKGVINETIQ